MPTPSNQSTPLWERRLVEKLATEALHEKRRSRYWGIFFKLTTLTGLITAVLLFMPDSVELTHRDGPHTALIELHGTISDTEVDAARIVKSLHHAFNDPDTQAIILQINSPGGSPVQSSYIQKAIQRLRGLHPSTPLYAVIQDFGASGAYYVASAADHIYVNESSIVGSIGVRLDGFGFTGTMQKLGVERRLYTAGQHKGMLDPFSPVTATQRLHAETLLNDIHQTFITAVKQGRGDRLGDDPNLFSGMIWSGQQSIQLGLADAIGNTDSVAREVIQQENLVNFTLTKDPLDRLTHYLSQSLFGAIQRLLSSTYW